MANANKVENQDYFAVSQGVEPLYLEGSGKTDEQDPHAWLDIANGMRYVENITRTLSEKDPENQVFYEENAAAYLKKLAALHQKSIAQFAEIPVEKKRIVTSEGSFKYFSKAYDVPASYIWEINTEEEGTPEQMTQLVDQLKNSQVPVLFLESSVNPKPMESISKDTGLPIYSRIFTDSVAAPGEEGDSYYRMMEWNIEQITQGLSQ